MKATEEANEAAEEAEEAEQVGLIIYPTVISAFEINVKLLTGKTIPLGEPSIILKMLRQRFKIRRNLINSV